MESIPKIRGAHAFLVVEGRYVWQLRDSKPGIASPGMWNLFGGHTEAGETPLQTVKREVYEELSIKTDTYEHLFFIDKYLSLIHI